VGEVGDKGKQVTLEILRLLLDGNLEAGKACLPKSENDNEEVPF
jgi:hypothetical protein